MQRCSISETGVFHFHSRNTKRNLKSEKMDRMENGSQYLKKKNSFLDEIDTSTDTKTNHLTEQKTGTISKFARTHTEIFYRHRKPVHVYQFPCILFRNAKQNTSIFIHIIIWKISGVAAGPTKINTDLTYVYFMSKF